MNATSVALDRTGVVATLRIAGDVTSASEGELMAGYARAIDDGVALDDADDEAGDVVIVVTIEARHLGRLAAEQNAAILTTA